jgi:hypothetical protein
LENVERQESVDRRESVLNVDGLNDNVEVRLAEWQCWRLTGAAGLAEKARVAEKAELLGTQRLAEECQKAGGQAHVFPSLFNIEKKAASAFNVQLLNRVLKNKKTGEACTTRKKLSMNLSLQSLIIITATIIELNSVSLSSLCSILGIEKKK